MSRSDRRSVTRGLVQLTLVPAAAFAVHGLRYMLAYGANAGAEVQRTGHSYLHSVVPWIIALLAVSAGGFLRALGKAFSRQQSLPRYAISFTGLWLACAAALVGIFACQEFLEGLFATGHPAGLAGIFGFGGWWSIPAALCVGLVLAAALHGARWVLREVAEWRARVAAPRRRSSTLAIQPRDVVVLLPVPLVGGWSGRGPPA